MRKADLLKAIDEYANTEWSDIEIDIDDDTWMRIAVMAHERDITFNQMVCIILEEQIEEERQKQEEKTEATEPCEVRYCQSGRNGTVVVFENIGDGCWRANICPECAGVLKVSNGEFIPDNGEEIMKEYWMEEDCSHDNTVLTAQWGNVCKDCGQNHVVTKEECE